MTSITAILATHNRRAILERTLAALTNQTERPDRIVVVDDGSSDDTWQTLGSLSQGSRRAGEIELVALRQDHGGQGAARNLALTRVSDGLVLFMGDDIIPDPDFVARHRQGHAGSMADTGVVGFTDWYRDEMRVTPALEMANREGHQFGYGHMKAGEEVPFTCFYTSNVSLPRQILGDNPFDKKFTRYGWEDVELGYRLSRAGLKLFYRPEARARHLHPMGLADLYRRQVSIGLGFPMLLGIHPELRNDSRLAPSRPPSWFTIGKWLVPAFLPLLSALDQKGLDLKVPVLHRVLLCGFYKGLEQGRETPTR